MTSAPATADGDRSPDGKCLMVLGAGPSPAQNR